MTLRLILIRHAKSSWEHDDDDHIRPLTERGEKASRALGAWLQQHRYIPDTVLCSDATRARMTWDGLRSGLQTEPKVAFESSLYHAAPTTIVDAVKTLSGTVAVVGHNPGIAMAAAMLLDTPPDHPRFADYPTGATTIMDFDGTVAPRAGRVVDFIVPRDLTN